MILSTVQVYPVFIILLFVLCLKYAQSIQEIPGSLGSTVTLPCRFTGGTGNVIWYYIFTDGTRQPYSGNEYLAQAGLSQDLRNRLSITGNHALREYNLQISNLKQSDEGNYLCTGGTSELTRVHLYIPEPPTAVSVPTLVDQNRILGIEDQDLTIECQAVGGKPPPEVTLKGKDDNYVYKTGIQSLKYTFSMIKRDFDLKTLLCEVNSSAISNTMKQEMQIYLDLKPFTPDISPEPEATENLKLLFVVCTSRGSRPAGSIYWKIGQISITANSTQNTTHDLSTDTYNMISELTYTVDRSHNGKMLTCGAVNKILLNGRETSKAVNVTFAPDVSVSNVTYNQNDSTRTVTCTAVGNPPVYVYNWFHVSTYGEVVREWTNLQNGVLTIPNITFEDRYQDSGEYKCTASNGVVDAQGHIIQHTGTGYVKIHALPVFTLDNNQTQYGEFGKSTDIHVHVYSMPMYTKTTWYKDNIMISDPSKYVQSNSNAIVHDTFHTKPVILDGHRVTLTIYDLQEEDFTNYMVQLTNMVGKVIYSVDLYSAGPPQTPMNFSVTGSSSTTIIVQWIPGFNGGFHQTFYIEYRIQHSVDWISSIPIADDNTRLLHQIKSYTLQGLQPGTVYELRMYASNVKNQSKPTTTNTTATLREESQVSTGAVIGGVAGGLVAVIVILVIVTFIALRKRRGSCTPCGKLRSKAYSENGDGLKDNILYQTNNKEYAEVGKKTQNTASPEYADVQHPNTVYAEVNKTLQASKDRTKKQSNRKETQKNKGKGQKTRKSKASDKEPESEYANADVPLENMQKQKEKKTKNFENQQNRNLEGLQYADLSFSDQTLHTVIHGNEDRTVYSEVDLTKKATAPPAESAYEQTNIRQNLNKS